MATTKAILFNNLQRTVVKIVGDGVATITMAEILHTIHEVPQTLTGAPVRAPIIGYAATCQDAGIPITVVRNGITLMQTHGNFEVPFDHSNGGFILKEGEDSDIVVTIPAGGGTVLLEIRKDAGFTFGRDLANIAV